MRASDVSESLLHYYEQELLALGELAREFAAAYPERAVRLGLHATQSLDPHVERLIQAVALLTGRIRAKLDDEFPELTDALLGVLYPHYLAPIPSFAVVQFDLDPDRGELAAGFSIPRHSRVSTAPLEYEPGKATPCRFRTCYPVVLWPVTVASAGLTTPPFPGRLPHGTKAIMSLRLSCQAGNGFADLDPGAFDRLRFYLYGENVRVARLYESLFNEVLEVRFQSPDRVGGPSAGQPISLSPEECVFPVGFEKDEGLLPYPPQSFPGYRLLTEFFAFPGKFFFLDLGGVSRLRSAGFGREVEVLFFLRQADPLLLGWVRAETFRLGCTPVVNLFEQLADPIPLTEAHFEYRVVPDSHHRPAMEVYSVNEVSHTNTQDGRRTEYQPFYSFRHGRSRLQQRAFWYASRRQAADGGTEVYLNLIDLDFDPRLPDVPVLHVQTTCSNRNLARQLRQAGELLALTLEMAAPLAGIRCPHPVTLPIRPPRRRGAYWRLLSHLSLNHLSLVGGAEGCEALKEILRLYDHLSDQAADLTEGILSVEPKPLVERVTDAPASGFARGVEVTVEFDRQKCLSTGVYLFACILERFLGLYASVNSFSRLVGKVRSEKEGLKRWPARAGEQQFL
jgi:type VI secretion system protein ImpG